MNQIGEYRQLTPFTNENAGTAEWCMVEKYGQKYFAKKFQSPVYPSRDLGLPEKKYASRVAKFHSAIDARKKLYQKLRENDEYKVFVIPEEVISYQYHICTIAKYITGNVKPEEICKLSEWQRIVLMRTLTLALMCVHNAGVVHSDMKPENVMIYQNEQNGSCALKLIDFDGSFYESNPPEDILGDPTYSAPEIYAMSTIPNVRLDHRIDVFALGIILHYFWTGKLPQKEEGLTLGQAALKSQTIILDPSLPVVLRDVIQQALQGNPEKRITTNDIYQKLGDLLKAYPVKIINLQEDKKKKGKKKPEASRDTPPARKTKPAPITKEKPEKKATITIICLTKSGTVLSTEKTEVEYGKSKTVYPPKIKDYQVITTPMTIYVNKDGKANISTVRFTYKSIYSKESEGISAGWKVFWAIVVIALVVFIAAKALAESSPISVQGISKQNTVPEVKPTYNLYIEDLRQDEPGSRLMRKRQLSVKDEDVLTANEQTNAVRRWIPGQENPKAQKKKTA